MKSENSTQKKAKSIPVNPMVEEFGAGMGIGKASTKDLRAFEKASQAHRDNYHLFFLLEKGTATIEIDFQMHTLNPSSVIYIHPNQVHRVVAVENVTIGFLAIDDEHLYPEYMGLLGDIAPVNPLTLTKETMAFASETVAHCLKLSERKQEKLYHTILKNSCNTVVAFIVSQYLEHSKPTDTLSRFEVIAKSFRERLERNFIIDKRPAAYAQALTISTSYLNECVRNVTGCSVSYHIHQRIVLEAKRLLYHSDKSVKEIAHDLGYEDYAYFSRLFTQTTGMSALTFRAKNRD